MNSIFILVPITFVLLAIAVAAWLWCVRNEQFDNLDAEAQRILFEEQAANQHDRSEGESNG